MATTKTFDSVRLQLKYDTITEWTSNNPVLLKGEIAVTTVPNADGDVKQAPAVLFKVGDGTAHYNDLKFASGLAANVHNWALAENKPTYAAAEITGLSDFISTEIKDTNTTYQILKVDDYTYKLQYKELDGAWTDVAENGTVIIPKYDDTKIKADIEALQTKVGDTTVNDQITSAIEALDLANTYDAKGAATTALASAKAYTDELANGAVAANTAAIEQHKTDVTARLNLEDEAIAAAQGTADKATTAINTLTTKVGTVPENKTVVEMISDAQTAASYDDTVVKESITANTDRISAIEEDYLKTTDKEELETSIGDVNLKVEILIGEDTDKSARAIAAEEIAKQLIPEDAKDSLDTLQEIAAWIQSHPDDAAAMNDAITALETKVGSTNVDDQITAAIDALKTGDIKAATDRITTLEGKAHTHANATVLDGISAEKVEAWDAAKTGVDTLTTKVGTVTEGKTLVEMISDAQTAATYDDTAVRGLIKTNADDIDAVEARATALETNAVLLGDALILNCGNSVIAE